MTYEINLNQALRRLLSIEKERILLKGHFPTIAKQYHVKVKDLKALYLKNK